MARRRQRGSVLVVVLIMGLFLAALGMALLTSSRSFLDRANLKGQEAQARALAQGSLSIALAQIHDLQSDDRTRGELARGTVTFSDGTRGTYSARFDMDLKVLETSAAVGEVEKSFLARFEQY